MPDLVPVAGDVYPTAVGSSMEMVVIGETVSDGDVLYYDSSLEKWYVCDCTDADKINAQRVAMVSGILDDSIPAIKPGAIFQIGAAIVKGGLYVLSEGGAIAPSADLASLDNVVVVGVGASTTEIEFSPWVTGYVY